jgi:uncharacterized repeat protein (TIGR01451 family)
MMSRRKRRTRTVLLSAAVATVALLPVSATALAATVSEYPDWQVSGHSGTEVFNSRGLPQGVIDSNSSTLSVPSGKSAFLNDSTPFGTVFGTSRDHGYLTFRTALGKAPSTTTITFDSPIPADRWGFTLGDIDADKAEVIATGASGKDLPTADLGWQGAFNYCTGSPLPPACSGKTDSDRPRWDAADSTLVGNGRDTDGASGWFIPGEPVKKLTIVYSALTGIPVGQLWIAAKPSRTGRDVDVVETARPHVVAPGDTVMYRITVINRGTVRDPDAEFRDNLAPVLIDAGYEPDLRASGGLVSFHRPVLSWEGPVDPGRTQTITYSVRVDNVPRSDVIRNDVVGEGSAMSCPGGRGHGCAVVVQIVEFCRAAVSGWPVAISRPETRSGREFAAC